MNEIGIIETTVHATTEDGRPIGDVQVHVPVRGYVVLRTESWERDGNQVLVDVAIDGTVLVAHEVLAQMMSDLGFRLVQ